MSDVFKVMLATDYDPEKLRFPCVATPKLDGIRAYVQGGVVLSRNNKPIPNLHVQTLFSGLEHYDGELIVGSPTSSTVFRDTTSGVMSKEGKPNVTYYVFDHLKHLSSGWQDRIENITAKRQILEEVFGEFRPMLRRVERAIYELNWDEARDALRDLEMEMRY